MSKKNSKTMSRAELIEAWKAEAARALTAYEELARVKAHSRYANNFWMPTEALKQCIEEAAITARAEAKDAGVILQMDRFTDLLKGFCAAARAIYHNPV